MTKVEITREDSASKARYVAKVDGIDGVGEMTLSKVNAHMIIVDHTETPDTMRGMGVAKALAERVVLDAREAGQKIIPLCPFLKSYAQRHADDVADVIKL